MILAFWMLSFKPVFFILLFHLHQDAFSSSFLYAIRVVSSLYLRLLMFLLAILIPACASSSLAFCMMYSAYRLNKQGDITQPWGTPFSILNQTIVPCLVLTVASWPAYRFHRKQVMWSGISIFFKNFPQFVVIHKVRGFNVVNEGNVFLECLCFFCDPINIANLISGSSAFSHSRLSVRSSQLTYCEA